MSLDIVKKVVKALDDKKANDIQVMQTGELTIVADYFVIATANSSTHVRALADEVEYQGVVVHIFLEESRNYYNLERLWEDATKVDVSQLLSE